MNMTRVGLGQMTLQKQSVRTLLSTIKRNMDELVFMAVAGVAGLGGLALMYYQQMTFYRGRLQHWEPKDEPKDDNIKKMEEK